MFGRTFMYFLRFPFLFISVDPLRVVLQTAGKEEERYVNAVFVNVRIMQVIYDFKVYQFSCDEIRYMLCISIYMLYSG